MKLLAIDTSTAIASFAISNGKKLYQKQIEGVRQHAQQILPVIEELLAESNLEIKELDGIVFGRGPGSFTGLRVACSVAKALGYSNDLPLYPVSSLAAIAFKTFQQKSASGVDYCLALIDARMDQVYWGVFSKQQFDAPEQVTNPEDVISEPDKELLLGGVGYEEYSHRMPQSIQEKLAQKMVVFPEAKTMISMVESGLIQSIAAIDAMPVYIRNQVTHGGKNG